MQKISLLLAINAARRVVCGGYEIEEFGTPDGYSASEAIRLTCTDEIHFDFAEQMVHLDPLEGVVTAIDLEGEEHDISLMAESPLTHDHVRGYAVATSRQPAANETKGDPDFTTELWDPAGARIGNYRSGIIAEFFGGLPLGNALRAVTCVNACRGLPNAFLKPNIVAALNENDRLMREALTAIAGGSDPAATAAAVLGKLLPTD